MPTTPEYMREFTRQRPGWHSKHSQAWAEANRERSNAQKLAWAKRNPEKRKAHGIVRRAIASGVLVRPTACSECSKECKPEASHDDYSKPLEVVWLCRGCHARKDISITTITRTTT